MRGAHKKKYVRGTHFESTKMKERIRDLELKKTCSENFTQAKFILFVNDIWKGAGAQDNFCLGLSLKSALQAIHIVVIINKLG